MGTIKVLQQSTPGSALERSAYTVPEFCFRNHLSRSAYQRLPRKPAEMRIGLNIIRITAEAEREWQLAMQEPNAELEQQALERAVKAGEAAVKSDRHVSKTRGKVTPPDAVHPRVRVKAAARDAKAAFSTKCDPSVDSTQSNSTGRRPPPRTKRRTPAEEAPP